jgi:hypothetical protein
VGRNRYTVAEQRYYRDYLNSQAWRERRAARIAKAGGCCEFVTVSQDVTGEVRRKCERRRYLQVHHNTYERLGKERDEDLDCLCWFHHQMEHILWKKCRVCSQPCLGHDALAELWLAATLAQMGIKLDQGPVRWEGLPTKERLLEQIHDKCMSCRGINLVDLEL